MFFNNRLNKIRVVFYSGFILMLIISTFIYTSKNTEAFSLGSPHWVERPVIKDLYTWQNMDWYDYDGNYHHEPPACLLWGDINAYTNFYHSGDKFTSSEICGGYSGTIYLNFKEAVCPAGEVMIGTRLYEATWGIDEEHQDAYCAPISGVTLGASRWVSAPNAYSTISGGYKTVQCATNEVMTGVRMFGIYINTDEEHIDALCTRITGLTFGLGSWLSAPNAWNTLYGGYKTVTCSANQMMTGVRWYENTFRMDDEHTDAFCSPESAKVNLWFTS